MNKELSQSPNLLEPQKVRSFAAKNHLTVVTISKFIIIITEIFFLGLLMYSTKLDTDINRLQKQVAGYEAEIESKSEVEKEARDVIERTKLLKSIRVQRTRTGGKIDTVMTSIPQNIKLKKTKFDRDGFEIEIEAPTALDISKVITNFLSHNVVSEITLKSANLDSNNNVFKSEMEGVYQAGDNGTTPFSEIQ